MRARTLRWLAAGLLVLWCGLFLRAENTEKSIVRALLLEPPTAEKQAWTVGLLYQFPEAAADASDAAAIVRLCAARGTTLEQALTEAENTLPRRADYRLCEYLLIARESSLADLRQMAGVLQEVPVNGLSAQVLEMDFSCEDLEFALEENEQLPEQLLQEIKRTAPNAPHLYESRNPLILPVLEQTETAVETSGKGLLLTEQGRVWLNEEETQMAQLLQGKKGEMTFELEGGNVTFRRCVVSVKAEGNGFSVILTGQRKAGTHPVTQAACEQLETLCVQTIQHCWNAGSDLLSLGAVQALEQGMTGEILTTKNACPQVQADVCFLQF